MKGARLLKYVSKEGIRAELIAEEWLKRRRFCILYSPKGKPSNKPYDIIAERGSEKWVIDVKTGQNPSISLRNFKRLLEIKDIKIPGRNETITPNRVGYIFVVDDEPFLLEYNKRKYYAREAVKTRKRKHQKPPSGPEEMV